MPKLSLTFVLLVAALLLVGCGSSSSKTASTRKAPEPWYVHGGPSPFTDTRHVVVKKLPHVGLVLIDGKGFMLYAFVPDKRGAVCAGSCVASWPPFTLTREHVLDASPILNIERFAIEPKEHYPEGARVVSYAGWLLHSFVGDTSPGVARGQGLHSDGGHWYLILPSGKLVTTAV